MAKIKTKIQLVGLFLALNSFSTLTLAQEFNFRFNFHEQVWNHPVTAETWEKALERASQDCLNHFAGASGNSKVRVDQDTADTLLDTCVNPH